MLRLPSKLFMLRKIPNAHILFVLQSRSKSDWFIDKAVQKANLYGRVGSVTHMLTINRNSSTEQPPNWRLNLKADWDQLILEDKIKLLYYSIWAIIASGFMFLIFTPASDTDDKVRKKEMVDWECKSSFVHEKEMNEDVNGLVQKNMEVFPKNNFVMIEKRKLAKLLQLEKTVANLHDVLTKSEQVLMKTNADIHKTRNTLHKLEENLDFYKEHAQAITADESVFELYNSF